MSLQEDIVSLTKLSSRILRNLIIHSNEIFGLRAIISYPPPTTYPKMSSLLLPSVRQKKIVCAQRFNRLESKQSE